MFSLCGRQKTNQTPKKRKKVLSFLVALLFVCVQHGMNFFTTSSNIGEDNHKQIDEDEVTFNRERGRVLLDSSNEMIHPSSTTTSEQDESVSFINDHHDLHRRDVINGALTYSIDGYPYTVSLHKSNRIGQVWHSCGGVLITPNIVLTAAHCWQHIDFAQVGKHETDHVKRRQLSDEKKVDESDYPLMEIRRSNMRRHPGYNTKNAENDFMLVRLPQWVQNITYIDINSNPNVPSAYEGRRGEPVTVLGWGATQHGNADSGSTVLRKAQLHYINNYQCGMAYGFENIKTNMLCAHSFRGKDSCNGDSGGPLIKQSPYGSKKDLLIGLVSWGAKCGSKIYPGVYSRVSSAHTWINNVVCNDLSPESCGDDGKIIPNDEYFKVSSSPSYSPSSAPSRSENKANSPSPKESASVEQTNTTVSGGETCQDYGGKFYTAGKRRRRPRDCEWVASASSKFRLFFRCRFFAEYCPRTCSQCPDQND